MLTDGTIVLRAHAETDALAMTTYLSDWATAQWLLTVPHPYTHQDSLDWILTEAPEGWRQGNSFWFAIADATTDDFLGEIGLQIKEPGTRCAEVGYWLAPPARGRGLMRQALTLLLDWGFDELGLDRVDLGAVVGNHASLAVALGVGFQLEGTRRKRSLRRSDDRRFDEWVAGLLRDDWMHR
jgi:RimJ/RimL family protein N-acetyltransferase